MVQHVSEHHIEAEVKRIVGKLGMITKNNRLAPGEHGRLLQDFEALWALKVQRRRGL